MSTKASPLFRIAQHPSGIPLSTATVSAYPIMCARCGKPSNSVWKVRRKNKSGTYTYLQYRHRDNRKRGGYEYHYVKVER